jgi:segregation and condensation protein B
MAKKKKDITQEKSMRVSALVQQLAKDHFTEIQPEAAEELATTVASEIITDPPPIKEEISHSEIVTSLDATITDTAQIKQTLEAVIFAAPKSITLLRLKNILTHFNFDVSNLTEILDELVLEYSHKGFQLVKVGNGFQFRTHPGQSDVLQKLLEDKPARLSPSALEVLAIVAYKQPLTRAEIDSIRGVDSGHLMKGLLEKNLVRSLGHAETPGRPLLFGTTSYFLEVFSLESLDDLPNSEEMNRELAAATGVEGEESLILNSEAQGGYDGLININSSGLAAEPDRGIFDQSAEINEDKADFGIEERAKEEVEATLSN